MGLALNLLTWVLSKYKHPGMNRLTRMSIPIIFGQLGQMLFGIIDTVMVGRLGVTDLAACAFVNNLMSFPMITIIGYSSAISVVVSERVGAGQSTTAFRSTLNGMRSLLVFMIVALGGGLLMYWNLDHFGQPPEIVEMGRRYFLWMTLSLVPMTAFMALRQFSDGIGFPSGPMVVVFATAALNFVLNGVLMYGWLGGPRLGLEGAGIATALSRLVMFGALIVLVLKHPRFVPFRGQSDTKGLLTPADPVFRRLGLPSSFQYLFEVGAFAGAGIIMGWMGTQALAAHQIAINAASVTFMISMGVSLASTVLIGEARGAKDFSGARQIGIMALKRVLVLAAVICAIFILGRNFLPGFYTSDAELIRLAGSLLVVAGLFQFFDCTQCVLVGVLRGYQDTAVPTVITLIGYWGFALPFCYYFSFVLNWGPQGVWAGLAVGLGLVSAALLWRFRDVSRRSF